jgi:long-subunit acyl-CoA synthetase (AMP-forming)
MRKFGSFGELVQSWGACYGTALYFEHNGVLQKLSYPALARRVETLAEELRQETWPSEFVAADHSPDCVIRIFADVLAGKDVVLADALLPEETMQVLLRASQAAHVWCLDAELGSQLSLGCPAVSSPAAKQEGNLVFFTSGTTSSSKAVVLSSKAFCSSAWNGQSMLACGPQDIILSLLPFAHVFGFVCTLLWGLSYQAGIALGRGVRHYQDDCSFFRPTILPAVPSLVSFLLKTDALNPQLKTVLIGAAPCPMEIVAQLHERSISVRLGYGLTETASGIAITTDDQNTTAMTPCPEDQFKILPDGEIAVHSSCLMLHYLDGTNPAADGWLATGDYGALDDQGRLTITGRKKDMLVLADGMKIWCPEYEEDLAKRIGTQELAVILKNGRPALVISGPVSVEKAVAAVNEFNTLRPRSQQISGILYTQDKLPRTATGKLQRWAI